MKDIILYPEALELKDLGFDEFCFGYYNESKQWVPTRSNSYLIPHLGWIFAPTYAQAFRFFREKYDIHYSINRECSQHDHKWGYNWSLYNYGGLFHEYLTSHPNAPAGEWVYLTYEEAELACLKQLIEIVKTK